MALEQRDGNAACVEVHLERAIRLLVFCLARLCMYRIKDPPEEAFRHHQCGIRDRLLPELPKRAGAEPQVLGRERGEAIAHEHHTLECDLDQRRITLLPQVPKRRRTSARRPGLRRNEILSGVGRRGPSTCEDSFLSDKWGVT